MRGDFNLISQNLISWSGWLVAQTLGISILGLFTPDFAAGQIKKEPAKTPKFSEPTVLPKTSTKPVLKLGSQGEEVTELQGMLKLLGYYTGSVSGVYDESTAAAVTKFQKAANLGADGVAGTDTWSRLLPPSPAIAPTPTNPNPAPKSTAPESFPAPSAAKPTPNASTKKPTNSAPKTTATLPTGGDGTSSGGQESVSLPVLRLGMKGPAVEGLQERLRALGYLKGSTDGVFGPETQAAVRAAQRQMSLETDGVVGASTWSGLLR